MTIFHRWHTPWKYPGQCSQCDNARWDYIWSDERLAIQKRIAEAHAQVIFNLLSPRQSLWGAIVEEWKKGKVK